MPNSVLVTLNQMQPGHNGVVAEIQGGFRLIERLGALGIRSGKRISKISSIKPRGPITIEVDRAQVAIGFGMAGRIIVKTDEIT